MSTKILEVKNLKTRFKSGRNSFNAVDGVSFYIKKGETLGIVGESGCGKSVTSLSIMGLIKKPGKVTGEKLSFKDIDLLSISKKDSRKIRGNEISMIFQEPMTSLNPVYRIGNQIGESPRIHEKLKGTKLKQRIIELLTMVGIPDPDHIYSSYPHQLSGGMRQRVMIAIAMACSPDLLIADEPTTALDVTIQAQILELMKGLQEEKGMSMMLITHDLGVVSDVCDRVAVMYAGKIVETGPVKDVLSNPQHPYTKGLLKSLPKRAKRGDKLHFIPGQVPSPFNWNKGCRFADRCPVVMEKCHENAPLMFEVNQNQKSACWLIEEKKELTNFGNRKIIYPTTVAGSKKSKKVLSD